MLYACLSVSLSLIMGAGYTGASLPTFSFEMSRYRSKWIDSKELLSSVDPELENKFFSFSVRPGKELRTHRTWFLLVCVDFFYCRVQSF